MRRSTVVATLIVGVFGLIAVPAASASTEVGNDCTGVALAPSNNTVVPIARASASTLPLTVPAAGIATKWKSTLVAGPSALLDVLKVFRATPNPSKFDVVGESDAEAVRGGPNTFDTRIPVQAGDRFGLYGDIIGGPVLCFTGNAGDSIATVSGNQLVGSSPTFPAPIPTELPAVSAVVEPDVDGDGFGDESQDKCPRSSALQTACPTVGVNMTAVAGAKSLVVFVAASSDAPVTVTGQATVPKVPRKKSRASTQVALTGGTQNVAPGAIGSFTIPYPKSIKSALKKLPASKKVSFVVHADATDTVGAVTTADATASLKGMKKKGK